MRRNLTQEELLALPVTHNLCDGHAYRRWTDAEAAVIASAARLFREADRIDQHEIESNYIENFFALARQSRTPEFFSTFMVFTASMAIEIVANYLRLEGLSVALIEPCFDNLADILRRHGAPLQPFSEAALAGDLDALDRQLKAVTADAIFLVTPNNPTGLAIDQDSFSRIVDFCRVERKLLVLDACFRFYLPDHAIYDQYRALADADIDCVIIEDTGKTWPTSELKAPFLSVSPRLAQAVARLHSDFLLHVSPFTVRLLTEFVRLSRKDACQYLRDLVIRNRSALYEAIVGSVLRPADAGYLSLAWLAIDHPSLRAADLKRGLAAQGVRVLSGDQFYWSDRQLGERYLRVALVRDPEVFDEAVQRLGSTCGYLAEAI
jgi:aspartate/methionine/tyrosine aminotransferase